MSNPHDAVRSYSRIEGILRKTASISSLISLNQLGQVRYGPISYNLYMLDIKDPHPSLSSTMGREKGRVKKNLCISAGIHGDEPAGVEALIGFLKMISPGSRILRSINLTIFPCNNPYGYETGRRTNGKGNDLNREFRKMRPDQEVSLIRSALEKRSFDFSLELHEDVDSIGFYLYELKGGEEESFGKEIINIISKKYPINLNEEIEGMGADNGVISPNGGEDEFKEMIQKRRRWPQALYQFNKGTRHCITCETPVHLKMEKRINMHMLALEYILKRLGGERSRSLQD